MLSSKPPKDGYFAVQRFTPSRPPVPFSYPCKGMKKTIPAEIHSFNGYFIIRKKFFLKI